MLNTKLESSMRERVIEIKSKHVFVHICCQVVYFDQLLSFDKRQYGETMSFLGSRAIRL